MTARTLCLALGAMVAVGGCGETRTVIVDHRGIAIADAYATASAAPEVSSVYFTVLNQGTADDTLLSVQTVGSAALHTVATHNGLTSMSSLDRLPVPRGTCVMLKPGGYHIMLTNLPKPLAAGDSIDVTIEMAVTGAVQFRIPVVTYTDLVDRLDSAGSTCP